jgi:HEAT repeat protein
MALVKKHETQIVEELPHFDTLEEADSYFEKQHELEHKFHAVEQMIKFEDGPKLLVHKLLEPSVDKTISAHIASVLGTMDTKEAPIETIMELLKLDNAYTRNLGISMLQSYGDAIRYYIVKFLIGEDRDLRIFAINVLGDVNFAESRDMLIELLESEHDINVAMTAVDYMAEIGQEADIPLLESLKDRFSNDAYATFAIDNAIRLIKG